jgi:hydrogenase expression/formation protein HypC
MCLAVPMEILEIKDDTALVDQAGVKTRVNLMICDEHPEVGDYVIVHAGFAIRRMDAQAAQESLATLNELVAAVDRARAGRE